MEPSTDCPRTNRVYLAESRRTRSGRAIVGLRQTFLTTTTNAGLLIGLPAIFLADTKPSRWLFIQSTANDVTQQYPGAIEIINKRHFSSPVLWSIITALPRPLSN